LAAPVICPILLAISDVVDASVLTNWRWRLFLSP